MIFLPFKFEILIQKITSKFYFQIINRCKDILKYFTITSIFNIYYLSRQQMDWIVDKKQKGKRVDVG